MGSRYAPTVSINTSEVLWHSRRNKGSSKFFRKIGWLEQLLQSGLGRLTVEVPKSNTHKHTVWFLWTNDKLVAEDATYKHTTNKTDEHPCPQRDSNPRCQQSGSRRPTSGTHGRKGLIQRKILVRTNYVRRVLNRKLNQVKHTHSSLQSKTICTGEGRLE